MSVAIRTATRLVDQDDVNVTPAVGVDEYALTYDHDTAKFVLRAPAAAPDLSGYALLAGRAGGQTLYGGTAANDDITIHGTSDATRTTSYVLLQPSGGNVGIGVTGPATALHIKATTAVDNAVFDVLTLEGAVTGSGGGQNGYGPRIVFRAEDTALENQDVAGIAGIWTDAAPTSATSAIAFFTRSAGGTVTRTMTAYGDGRLAVSRSLPLSTLSLSDMKAYANTPGQVIGELSFTGYLRSTMSASIQAQSPGWDDVAHLCFKTSDSGAGAQERMRITSTGLVGIGTTAPATLLHGLLTSAATNAVTNVVTIGHDTSGTAAAGFGAGQLFTLESSTTAAQDAARIQALWYEATHATRKADLVLTAYDTVEREGLRIRGAGSAPAIGFLGAAPVARQAHVADPAGGATVDAEARSAINSILATLENFGLHATS